MSASTPARRGRVALASALVVGSMLVRACGSSSNDRSGAKTTATSSAASGTSIVIDTFMFSPKTLHVKVGDTVMWTNHDDILHTVTSGTREDEPGDSGHVTATHKSAMFDMQLNGKGATATFTFTNAGTFH